MWLALVVPCFSFGVVCTAGYELVTSWLRPIQPWPYTQSLATQSKHLYWGLPATLRSGIYTGHTLAMRFNGYTHRIPDAARTRSDRRPKYERAAARSVCRKATKRGLNARMGAAVLAFELTPTGEELDAEDR